ncbi:class I SAM-dependent methyltransferase [Mesorhizobium sp. M0293]|uniref:class I SAM-dependent methyltransferase n=1 Tax=unclassified Mesorhizobium TaxID=325217 RepID=UPI00333D8547
MLAPGQVARRVLGRHFEPVGNVYRRVFVNLNLIADFLDGELPNGAKIVDIGGGDGALIERLLNRRPDLAVTMCDLAPSIGTFLSDVHRARVVLLPATDLTEVTGLYDAVTISDVIHHVPVDQRDSFFKSLASSCERWACRKIILKDIEPGGVRATLSLLADRHITGDKHVVLFSRSDFAVMARRYFPKAQRVSAVPDWPNYCEVLSW